MSNITVDIKDRTHLLSNNVMSSAFVESVCGSGRYPLMNAHISREPLEQTNAHAQGTMPLMCKEITGCCPSHCSATQLWQ